MRAARAAALDRSPHRAVKRLGPHLNGNARRAKPYPLILGQPWKLATDSCLVPATPTARAIVRAHTNTPPVPAFSSSTKSALSPVKGHTLILPAERPPPGAQRDPP